MASVYEIVTDRIIRILEQGVIPWQKPWNANIPRNITGRAYNGVNLLLLASASYRCPIWATFKQISDRGGYVKAGEKSTPVVFWKRTEKTVEVENDDGEVEVTTETKWMLRYYNVFNLEQTTLKVEDYWNPETQQEIRTAEGIIKEMPNPPRIEHGGNRAFYRASEDLVRVPEKRQFVNMNEYYSTMFHELVHSTGHVSRLNRKAVGNSFFGSEEYSKEELVAEIGSVFLCAQAGVKKVIKNQAAYIRSWLQALRNDKRMIVVASSQAQKAADYILGGRHEGQNN